MSTKPGLPFADHVQHGADLLDLRNRLLALAVDIGPSYPKRHPLPVALHRAVKALDHARDLADRAVFAEHPDRACPHVYYARSGVAGCCDPALRDAPNIEEQ